MAEEVMSEEFPITLVKRQGVNMPKGETMDVWSLSIGSERIYTISRTQKLEPAEAFQQIMRRVIADFDLR